MFCKECGAAVADGVKFCGSCGIKVEDVPMEAPASASDQTAQAIPPEKKTTEQNYWDKLNPTQRKGHIYGIPFFILMAIAGVTLKNTAKDSPQNSPVIDEAIYRSFVSFNSVDNNFALILDASPELRKNVKEYIERAVHGGLAKDSIKKIGNHEIIDQIKYAKLDNIVTGSLALIVLMPVLGPGFDNLVTRYQLDGMKATYLEKATINGKDIKVKWGGLVEIEVVPDGNNDKAVTLGGEPDPSTLGGQATPAPAVAKGGGAESVRPIQQLVELPAKDLNLTEVKVLKDYIIENSDPDEIATCGIVFANVLGIAFSTNDSKLQSMFAEQVKINKMVRDRLLSAGKISQPTFDAVEKRTSQEFRAHSQKGRIAMSGMCVAGTAMLSALDLRLKQNIAP